jgi:hypothetical protein
VAALTSSVDSKSKEFKQNAAAMAALLEELRRRREEAALGGADVERDVRGFALKFFTDEGNWDLVGHNSQKS